MLLPGKGQVPKLGPDGDLRHGKATVTLSQFSF